MTRHPRGAMRPSSCACHPPRMEGAGNAGCTLHPRSRAQNCAKKRTRAYRFSGGSPAFPAQWFDGLCCALPGDQDLFVTVAPWMMAEPPGWAGFASAGLDANLEASGPHSFAVRDPSSPSGFAGLGTRPTKLWRRRKQRRRPARRCSLTESRPVNTLRADAAASTTSHPAFVTIAIRPSWGMRWRELIELICPTGPAKYFFRGDWTTQITLKSLRKSKFTRNAFARRWRCRANRLQADLPLRGKSSAACVRWACALHVVPTVFRR